MLCRYCEITKLQTAKVLSDLGSKQLKKSLLSGHSKPNTDLAILLRSVNKQLSIIMTKLEVCQKKLKEGHFSVMLQEVEKAMGNTERLSESIKNVAPADQILIGINNLHGDLAFIPLSLRNIEMVEIADCVKEIERAVTEFESLIEHAKHLADPPSIKLANRTSLGCSPAYTRGHGSF